MNVYLSILFLLLMGRFAIADGPIAKAPEDQMVKNLDWQTVPRSENPAIDLQLEGSDSEISFHGLKVTYSGMGNTVYTLLSISPKEMGDLKTHSYAITGEVQYQEGWPGSYMQLWTHNGSWLYHDSWATGGPLLDFDKTVDWRKFRFNADLKKTNEGLLLLQVHLCLAGPCTLHFHNLKLVQDADVSASAQPAVPGQIVEEFSWKNQWDALALEGNMSTLWSISYPKITAKHFAVVGEARYQNVSHHYLEMFANFLPEQPGSPGTSFVTRNNAQDGPLGEFNGTSDWRPFWLPYDSSNSTTRLIGLVINANTVTDGDPSGVVYLRNVRLVQYPDETFPSSLAPTGKIPSPQIPEPFHPSTPIPTAAPALVQVDPSIFQKNMIALKSFWFFLGVATTTLSVLLIGGLTFLFRRLRRRRHEREMRRIASLDS